MIGNAETIIKWLFTQDRNTVFEVKEHKEKRSLNANAYLWVLVGKIADRLRASKDEIYLKCLKLYGQSEIVSVLSAIDVRGFFKYYEPIGTGHVDGREFTHYRIYKGSSEYDTREMSVLIDGVISEAKELDIETLPPHEIERMKQKWNRSCKQENSVTSAEGQTG